MIPYALHQYPSKKAMQNMRQRIKEVLGRRNVLWQDISVLIKRLNPILRGWRNYYGFKTASKWLAKIDWYILRRFTIWYNKKHQKKRYLSNMNYVGNLLKKLKLVKLAV